MGQQVTLLRSSTGLNTKTDPVRLPAGEGGVRDLAKAVNVVVDISGRVGRRKGYATALASGNFHSGWCDGGPALCVKDGALTLIRPDLSLVALKALIAPTERVAYCQVGARAYWCNGVEKGYVEGEQNYDWVKGTYLGVIDTDRNLFGPPVGRHLASLNGRLYVAAGRGVWISERGQPDIFGLDEGWLAFPTEVRLLASVSDGLWVGDADKIYFVAGPDPEQQTMAIKADYPAIEGTAICVDAGTLPYEGLTGAGRVVKFWTKRGLCLGGPSGFFLNETLKKLEWDKDPRPFTARYGAGIVWEDMYVCSLEP